jgi:hypothetical protein
LETQKEILKHTEAVGDYGKKTNDREVPSSCRTMVFRLTEVQKLGEGTKHQMKFQFKYKYIQTIALTSGNININI